MEPSRSTRLLLIIGTWITVAVTLLGCGIAIFRPKAVAKVSTLTSTDQLALQPNCQTVATDPQPPLNVRSEPNATSSQNIVGTIRNGTPLTVVTAEAGWLKINHPLSGWVYQSLTFTRCPAANVLPLAAERHPTLGVLDSADDRFRAGDLQAALSLLQSVPPTDMTYPKAQVAYQVMTEQWRQGNLAYQTAQAASATGQWQTVLRQVPKVPDVRYWREKMAPLVKRAIVNQNTLSQ